MSRINLTSPERKRRAILTVLVGITCSTIPLFSSANVGAPPTPTADLRSPLSPQEARKHFRLTAGLRIELVASEPQIESPVAMAFDEDGRLWVVEMRDYPNGPAKGQPPEGRIKLLEDRDGDGVYETSRVFADNLLFANGLMPWRGGLLVTAAPHILHLKDTDGDGKADRREVLYEGFAVQNPQLRVSHPNLGIDNWVYVANGLRNGMVKRTGSDAPPINLSGMDFRFDLTRDRHEAVSGMGQFGLTFDDWGRRFVCDNRHHLRFIALENRYVRRNSYLAVPSLVEDISVLGDGPLSSGGKVYPISKNWTTSSLHAGRFTAACGVFVYRGDLLPPEFRGSAFTCEPTGNLVHQEIVEPRGATFRARPAKDGVEFLASPDEWFRPVFLTSGPDGALYIVDMYRAVIEHPEFMPVELKNRPDLTLGKDRGRIWRIVPEKHATKAVPSRLGKATLPELVALLEHPNAWHRTTAQRLLLERRDRAAVEPLRKLALGSKESRAQLHAAWLLENLDALREDVVLTLLGSAVPSLREQGLVLAERYLPSSRRVQQAVLKAARGTDDRVRFQAALSLGEWDDDQVLQPLAGLAASADRWTRLAVASSVPRRAGALFALLCQRAGVAKGSDPDAVTALGELAALVGARQDQEEFGKVLAALIGLRGPEAHAAQIVGLNGLADGLGRRGKQLTAFLRSLPEAQQPLARQAAELMAKATQSAVANTAAMEQRLAAIRLLAHSPWEAASPILLRLVADDADQQIRLAAIRSLAAHSHHDVPDLLLKNWKTHTPAVRREVVEAMLRQPERTLLLLKAVGAGHLRPGEIDPVRARQLVNSKRPDIRDLAQKLLRDNLPADRKQVLDQYQPALSLKGDALRGKEVFQKNCATCHRVAGVGVDVGPDIADTRTKTPEMLLLDILNPNAAIDSNYVNYLVTTKSGKVFTGILAAETSSSITLRRAENQTDTVLRQDIDEIQSTGVSLMPEGLEKTIPVKEMADLIAFLKNWRYLDGSVPVGK